MLAKKMAAVFVAFLMVASPAIAQEAEMETKARLNANAGTTPDSILYGLDRAMERVQLLLATNPNARAEAHLKISEERLAEMEAMARVNKSEEAQEAAEGYQESSAEAANQASQADEETRADVDARLQMHVSVLQDLQSRFEAEGIAGLRGINIALNASTGARGSIAAAAQQAGDGNGSTRAEVGAEAGAETPGGSAEAEAGVNVSGAPPTP